MVVGTCSMALGMVAMPVSGLPLELFRVDILSTFKKRKNYTRGI